MVTPDTQKFAESLNIVIYEHGFTEHIRRLVFWYGEYDSFRNTGASSSRRPCYPRQLCILPCLDVETEKVCKPHPECGLTGYAIARNASEQALETVRAKCPPNGTRPYGRRVDPFIFRRKNGTYAHVQSWGVHINDRYKKRFNLTPYRQGNPDPSRFEENAVDEFCLSMERLFCNPDAERASEAIYDRVFYATGGEHINLNPVYVGQSEDIMEFLFHNDEIQDKMRVKDISGEGDPRLRAFIKYEGHPGAHAPDYKDFEMPAGVEMALYMKTGYENMAMATPLELFAKERIFIDPDANRARGGRGHGGSSGYGPSEHRSGYGHE